MKCATKRQVRIWDWEYYREERALTGHGWDVKTVEWHPYKSLIVSGSKDNLVKLWDPRTGNSLSTLYGHKNTVMKVINPIGSGDVSESSPGFICYNYARGRESPAAGPR